MLSSLLDYRIIQIRVIIQVTMKPKLRISIDEYIPNYQLSKTQSLTPMENQSLPSNKRRRSELMSIHKNSDSKKELMEVYNDIELACVSLKKEKLSSRYAGHKDEDEQNQQRNQPQGFISSNEHNRITFSQTPSVLNSLNSPYSISKNITEGPEIFRKRVKITANHSRFKKPKYLQKIEMKSEVVGLNYLEKAVQDLEQHNKNIMKQTKQTVQDFQNYIEQLLQSNLELEANVEAYEKYIEDLENERQATLEQQKQRQIQFQKVLKQKLYIEKQLQKNRKAPKMDEQIQIQIKTVSERLTCAQQELQSKRELIELLQSSIEQKQQIIKKMTQFNNEMCIQIMALKANEVQFINNESQILSAKLIQSSKQDNRNNTNFQVSKKLQEMQSENKKLKLFNLELQKKVQQMNQQNQSILIYIENQMRLLKNYSEQVVALKSTIKKYERDGCLKNVQYSTLDGEINSFTSPKNQQVGQIVKNAAFDFRDEYRNGRSCQQIDTPFDNNFQFSEIMLKGDDVKLESPFDEDSSFTNKLILKKMNSLLNSLSSRVKSEKSKNYQMLLHNLMRTLRDMDQQLNSSLIYNSQIKEQNRIREVKSDCILKQLQDKEQQMDSNISSIIVKNEEVLKKVEQVKNRLKKYVGRPVSEGESKAQHLNAIQSGFDKNMNEPVMNVQFLRKTGDKGKMVYITGDEN